jgi:Uma2 family endonuclease
MHHEGELPSGSDEGVLVQHRIRGFSEKWLVGDQPVPEAAWHYDAVALLKALLDHWVARTTRDAAVYGNFAVRVRGDRPSVGFDPDLLVVEPAPPGARDLSSLRLWEPEHAVPSLVIEVVSPRHPYKDYAEIPDKCAALGVGELIVFDPKLVGPKVLGGPQRLQVWRRKDSTVFERVASGEGPFRSAFLDAHLVVTDGGRHLRIAEDEEGRQWWPTAEETERQLKESERQLKEAERQLKESERKLKETERELKEQALARVAELERRLGERG